jgi:hypothetical protein
MSRPPYTARQYFLEMTDPTNWPEDAGKEYAHAMELVHEGVMDWWSELELTEYIDVVETTKGAIYPYMVETKPNESWSAHTIWKELEHAQMVGRAIRREHPNLPVRILHYTGPSGPPF